jgi:hypothetical protein
LYNWPSKLPKKSMDEKVLPSVAQTTPLSFIRHKMATASFTGYNNLLYM